MKLKILDIKEKEILEQEAFNTFAELHPLEAWETYRDRFYEYCRDVKGLELSNERIDTLIKATKK